MSFTQHSARARVRAGLRVAIACGAFAALASASSATPARSAEKSRKSAVVAAAPATGLENLEKQVQEFTLPNGLRFILVERHDTPIFSFETRVNTGGAQELPGITGIAHMMEHMAFKGTERVGTSVAAAPHFTTTSAQGSERLCEMAASSVGRPCTACSSSAVTSAMLASAYASANQLRAAARSGHRRGR